MLFLLIVILLSVYAYYKHSDIHQSIKLINGKTNIKNYSLIYRVNFFNVIPVGIAKFYSVQLKEDFGKKAIYLAAEAKSTDTLNKLFSAKVSLESFLDAKESSPYLFRQKTELPSKAPLVTEVRYDQEKHVMIKNNVERSILVNTQDPLSLIYNLRKMDFEKTNKLDFNINTNQKNYIFDATVVPFRKRLSKNLYLLDAQIRRRDKNNPYHRTNLKIIFLKQEENIPIFIRVFSSGALLTANLIDVK